jgi:predicted O-methyltransferase YrrM
MSYHNWFHEYFKHKNKFSTTEEIVDDVLFMLEHRGMEYLENNEVYAELFVDPNIEVVNSKPQIIQQVKEELREFLELLVDNKVRKILQIGLGHYGSTQFCLSLICDQVITVEFDQKNIRNYADREILYNQNVENFVWGDSTNEDVIKEVKKFGEFDCLFIDGNHSYEFVKKDYENYSKLVKLGGIVAFHDAFGEGERYGTPRVLDEIESEIDDDIHFIKHSNEIGIAYFKK